MGAHGDSEGLRASLKFSQEIPAPQSLQVSWALEAQPSESCKRAVLEPELGYPWGP